ncbi:hypothetical protein DCC81_25245 [Chitinophaga parva]|uniref:DUF4262 domain-containing protein n=1 Tax=Chitinophaga parva TaxID=2169414 RepID=A0A2T7BB82_9BACT|nr:DUF4262 domain-containing protein [Chitinophaga parva]PUZ21316.1 hypothetical protein DCC81_25245 [Chitinophaga parva]
MSIPFFDDALTKQENWQQEILREYGWYVHFVPNDEMFPNHINFHTHGLEESFNHPDLQMCFPLDTKIAHGIFSDAVTFIREGKSFRTGVKYTGVIEGDLSVEFIEAKEGGRTVLRMIFPNREGTYEGQIFAAQFEGSGD